MVYRAALGGPIFGLRREIDRLFEDTFGREGGRAAQWAPAVDIREDARELAFEVELAGIKPENVDIMCENGVLTVRGEKHSERKEGDEERYHLVERTFGSFLRSFQLPQGVDEDKIEADFENGVLMVRIPKAALPQPRKIQIRGAGQQKAVAGESKAKENTNSQPRPAATR